MEGESYIHIFNRLRDNISSVVNVSVVKILRGIQEVTQNCLNIEKILTDNRNLARNKRCDYEIFLS